MNIGTHPFDALTETSRAMPASFHRAAMLVSSHDISG